MRHTRLIALGAIILLLLCVVFAPLPGHTLFIGTLHDSAHGPIFGLLSLLMLMVLRSLPAAARLPVIAQYVLVFVAAVFLGAATKVAQAFTHRDPSFEDIQRDAIGAAAFLLLFSVFDHRTGGGRVKIARRVVCLILALALFAVLAAPLIHSIGEYRVRDGQFPVLVDFSHHPSRYFVWLHDTEMAISTMPAEWAASAGEKTLHVQLSAQQFPGVEIIEPSADWRGYSTLAVDLTNPTVLPLHLTIRIHDAHHNNAFSDRFNRAFTLETRQRQIVRIPLKDIESGPVARRMDMSAIAGIVIFRSDGSNTQMYISRAWLE